MGAESELLQLAATVESGTQHPLAQAILQAAVDRQLELLPGADFQTIAGSGVAAIVHRTPALSPLVRLGTLSWLESLAIVVPESSFAQATTWAHQAKTVVGLAIDETFAGLIAISDAPRPEAAAVIEQLRLMGLDVLLLTGDQPETAIAIARQLGLDAAQVRAGVKPAAKAAAIAQLQQQQQIVAMVGDGINDAPALAQADVGIALAAGTAVATETADILLMRNSLQDVAAALKLSRVTFQKIQQNLFWAAVYNVVAIPIAAGVLLPIHHISLAPSAAGLLMALSSISVVTNSLLLRWQLRQ
jgi:P-type Cu2+ transporter